MSKVRIRTTQNVFIEFETASLGDRILAGIIDLFIMGAYLLVVFQILYRLKLNEPIFYMILFAPYTFYHLLCEILLNGQSVGKKIRHIKVTRLDGTQPNIGNYLMRWILRPIDGLPVPGLTFGVAIIAISSNGTGQRIGDLAAGTTVINLRRRVNLDDTILPALAEDYQVVYGQASSLSDKDVALIREVIRIYMKNNNFESDLLLHKLADKIKTLLHVQHYPSPISFLEQVVKDHAFLTGK